MRVKISTNPPLPPVRAWFPLPHPSVHGQTIASLKSLLCATLPAFRGHAPSSLHLSIDGFELFDISELTVVRDGDLISVDVRDEDPTAHPRLEQGQTVNQSARARRESAPAMSRKRKRSPSSSSGSESDSEESSSTTSESESESKSETSDSDSGVEDNASVSSLRRAKPPPSQATLSVQPKPAVPPKPQPSTFVPPGYGKSRTQARNLRRRLKRTHEAANASRTGPVSGANAVAPGRGEPVHTNGDTQGVPALMSLSLRNKNKAKNFKGLMNRPLPPKIIFGDEEDVATNGAAVPRLVPPSMRSSLPPNLFVTSIDVETDLNAEKKKRQHEDELREQDISLDYGAEEDIGKLEVMANERWDTLQKPTRAIVPGTVVGYKALGIDAVTYTPGQVLTVGRVEACDESGLVVRPCRAVSFNWQGDAEPEEHSWEEIDRGNWRVLR